MKKEAKKAKPFKGFKPSPFKAEPLSKAFKADADRKKKPVSPIKEKEPPAPEPQPIEKELEVMAKERPKLDAIKETVSRIKGKIRNLENAINAARSTPPDPEVAAQFDAIQRDVETLENAE